MDSVNHIELTIHPSQVRPILRALLFAIFFHRTLDAVEPETLELLDSHIACAPNPTVEREVNAKIEEFAKEFLETGAERGELAVVFLQKKPKKGWFAITEELVPWEEHLITLHLSRTSRQQPATQQPLSGALLQLSTFCVEKKGNVPPLVGSSDQNNLSYQILIAPPPPSELFAPSSPPLYPTRLTSPPPAPSTTNAIATARDLALPPPSSDLSNPDNTSAKRASSPASATLGYLEQAKGGLRAVGAGVGWGGRAMGAAFGRGGGGGY
ncbi:hypothetical protein CI109_103942 [Kwoniella shandongensis]|uniref:Autophagy-related protein 101 n=1 Tax=Kwoniella shandongensis TaxID=1734106 RepID=A0A5M6BT09_9TREE|nr:uncharacterized protein CI109_005604 [Kwoniella shandongensis]KAA5526008.1 hypothetical protein CI109_005604 [Kwoniella shandongensis]